LPERSFTAFHSIKNHAGIDGCKFIRIHLPLRVEPVIAIVRHSEDSECSHIRSEIFPEFSRLDAFPYDGLDVQSEPVPIFSYSSDIRLRQMTDLPEKHPSARTVFPDIQDQQPDHRAKLFRRRPLSVFDYGLLPAEQAGDVFLMDFHKQL